jgi:KUP system potassium uptake protein
MNQNHQASPGHITGTLPALMLSCIGIVYGDIGTSPLYAIKECFAFGKTGLAPTPENVFGVLSLMIWSMAIVVSIKYIGVIMRADNRGEGGVLALMALATRNWNGSRRMRFLIILGGMLGAALFFGDGVITPAASVLSAVEGLEVATPVFHPFILPIALVILFFLFFFQDKGTAGVGKLFSPVMVLWFVTLVVLGLVNIVKHPGVLLALNPIYAFAFVFDHGLHSFVIFGAVFLCMTGGEALYADIGHFGRRPIKYAWFGVVMPAILINYFGQGALMLDNPAAVANPFFYLAPKMFTLPLVLLSTLATVIASQAVISGVFSVTRQAVQLGFLPRMEIVHTSADAMGQIYVPAANWILLIAVMGLVIAFRTSDNILAAYGIAVSFTMVIETVLALVVVKRIWQWGRIGQIFVGALLAFDIMFLLANSLKIPAGGWFPLVLAAALCILMSTWKRGRSLIHARIKNENMPMDIFTMSIASIPRVSGTAIFLTTNPEGIPHTLLHNLKHNKVLHERVVLMTLKIEDVPRIEDEKQLTIENLGQGFYRVVCRFGFMEDLEVPHVLELCALQHMDFDIMDTTFFLGRETLLPSETPGMAMWREHMFSWMWKNAARAMDSLKLPPNRVVELGTQVEI